jgi:hypothetical protein
MRRTLGLLASIAALGVVAPGVAHATKFSGDCLDIAGVATFKNGLKQAQEDNEYSFKGTAHCNGKMDGKAMPKDTPVTIQVSGPGKLGCAQGESTTPGQGTITVDGTGQVIPFKMTFTSHASEVDIKIEGVKSGKGTGSASFFNKDDPPANIQTLQNCGGEGNKSLKFTATASVPEATPLDDGVSAAAPEPASNPTPSTAPAPESAPSNTGASTQSKPAKKKHKAKKKPKKHKAKKKKKGKKGKKKH